MEQNYRKSFIPLESNPDVFNELMHLLGTKNLFFKDVISLDEQSLLPRPAIALVFRSRASTLSGKTAISLCTVTTQEKHGSIIPVLKLSHA